MCALLALPARAVVAKRVSGNLVFCDQARGFDSIVANADVFTETSPFWYRVLADGRILPYTTGSGASYEDPTILAFLRSRGIFNGRQGRACVRAGWHQPCARCQDGSCVGRSRDPGASQDAA